VKTTTAREPDRLRFIFNLHTLIEASNNAGPIAALLSRMTKRNLSKPFSIAGFVLGEIYMLAIVFGHSPTGEIVPLGYQFKRMLALAPFCGVSGALIGLGIGLLVSAILPKR
jgi:hypothetical protein